MHHDLKALHQEDTPRQARETYIFMTKLFSTLLLCALPTFALADAWLICDYSIAIRALDSAGLRAVVLKAAGRNPVSCLHPGTELSFRPETADYQNELPRRRWPQPQQTARLRYRELSGFCKNDGNTKPCTIVHYSILAK